MPVRKLIGKLTSARPTNESPLVIDDAIEVIQNPRRRLVIDALVDNDENPKVLLRDLAKAVASAEYETPPDQLDSDERKRVYISLYQTHLSTMDNVEVVDFNADRGTIQRGPAFEHIQRVLETVREECGDANGGASA